MDVGPMDASKPYIQANEEQLVTQYSNSQMTFVFHNDIAFRYNSDAMAWGSQGDMLGRGISSSLHQEIWFQAPKSSSLEDISKYVYIFAQGQLT